MYRGKEEEVNLTTFSQIFLYSVSQNPLISPLDKVAEEGLQGDAQWLEYFWIDLFW